MALAKPFGIHCATKTKLRGMVQAPKDPGNFQTGE